MPSLDGLGDPVFAITSDGTLLYANAAGRARCSTGIRTTSSAPRCSTSSIRADLALAEAALETVGTKRFGDLITLRARTGRGAWVYLEVRGAQAQPTDGATVPILRS